MYAKDIHQSHSGGVPECTEWRLSCANGRYVADNLELLFCGLRFPRCNATVTVEVVTIGLEALRLTASLFFGSRG